jgi:uncharacterized iron-regulated membrane protein
MTDGMDYLTPAIVLWGLSLLALAAVGLFLWWDERRKRR